MGMAMSFIAVKPSSRTITDRLYDIMDKNITEFEEFHTAILEVFTKVNSGMPGLHFDVPKRKEIKECYEAWKNASDDVKKKALLQELFEKKVSQSKTDNVIVMTGLVAPPASMLLKRKVENIPPLYALKLVPNIAFVPSATMLALILVKSYRKSRS